MESKKGMLFEEAKQKRGSKLVYLREPWLNLIVADKYKEDTSYAWIEIAKFYSTLTAQKKAKKVAIQQDGDTYYWMSFNLIISRLWHYGIRSKSTVSRALHLLCNPSSENPPLLKRIQKRDSNGHIRLYYAKTDVFDDLFDTDPEWAEDNVFEYKSSDEDDVFDDEEEVSSGEVPFVESKKEEVPEDWFPIFAQIRECGFYKDKADRDTKGEVFGYNQKLYTYISEILDGTFYDKSGKNITNRHDLTGLTKDQMLDWITKENRIPAGGTDYAHRTIVYTTSKATYSPLLNALCGKTASSSSKPAKFIIKEESYEPSKKGSEEPDRSPSSIWFGENNGFNERPDKYYPELTLNHPRVWGLYHAIKDYAASCKSPEGIWTKHNKPGTTVSDIDILYWVLRVASDHGCTSDEIFQNIIIGDDSNYLWALVIQYVFNNKGYKLARDEKKSSYLYCGAKDLSPSMYTKVVGKGAKK